MRLGHAIARVLALGVLLVTGVAGLYNGFNELPDAATSLQKAVTVGVFLYGVLGLGAAAGGLVRRHWGVAVAIAWGVVVTFVATAAPIAYGGPAVTPLAALAGGLIAALIALGVVWALRSTVKPRTD